MIAAITEPITGISVNHEANICNPSVTVGTITLPKNAEIVANKSPAVGIPATSEPKLSTTNLKKLAASSRIFNPLNDSVIFEKKATISSQTGCPNVFHALLTKSTTGFRKSSTASPKFSQTYPMKSTTDSAQSPTASQANAKNSNAGLKIESRMPPKVSKIHTINGRKNWTTSSIMSNVSSKNHCTNPMIGLTIGSMKSENLSQIQAKNSKIGFRADSIASVNKSHSHAKNSKMPCKICSSTNSHNPTNNFTIGVIATPIASKISRISSSRKLRSISRPNKTLNKVSTMLPTEVNPLNKKLNNDSAAFCHEINNGIASV